MRPRLISDSPDDEEPSTDVLVPALERGLRVIECLANSPNPMGPKELSNAIRIPLPSLHRIFKTLLAFGYVENHNGRYALTRKILGLVNRSGSDRSLLEASLGEMRSLRDRFRETVVMSVLDGVGGLILDQIPSLHHFRFVIEPGTRQALHAAASTKAILAFLPAEETDRLIAACSFERFTSTTITDPEVFRRQLAEVRESGMAFNHGEQVEGVYCLAAPIFDRHRHAIAALTISGPVMRLSPETTSHWIQPIREAAERISGQLSQ